MLYTDIPTMPEIRDLIDVRADACVSIYVPTTAQTQNVKGARIALKNLLGQALDQLETHGLDKRRRGLLNEHVDEILEDDEFWKFQSNSLCLLATPDKVRSYRLPNVLTEMVEVSDRFHLKPLLRAITFPHRAFILALAEDGPRLIEMTSNMPAGEVRVPDMPKDAGSATGRASVNDRSPTGRIHGGEGQKVLLRQYARKVDAAIRPLLAGRHEPLILAATEPLLSIWRSVNTYPGLADEGVVTSPVRMTPAELADAARPVLDGIYDRQVARLRELFTTRAGQQRATTDIASAARAATLGAVDTLLVDIDETIPGTVDDVTGAVTFARTAGAGSYGLVDEIAGRVLANGGSVLAVRKSDIPDEASLAAILRYPV